MDIRQQIKSLLSEAELYRTQGLLMDAKMKYESAAAIINGIEKLKNKQKLLATISLKIHSLEEKQEKVQTGPASPELSEKGQDLIKNLFGKDELEKAVALIKFGQFDRAIVELTPMLQDDARRLEVGKYILQCKMALDTVDDAVEQYKQWYSQDLFTAEQLTTLHGHLRGILDQKGINATLPAPTNEQNIDEPAIGMGGLDPIGAEAEEEILDITSIGITFTGGPQKGKMVEFDVNFQSGDMLSLIISKKDKGLIEALKDGDQLDDIQFYSPIAMFKGTAVIANKTEIDSGPKRGDFCLDLKVTST